MSWSSNGKFAPTGHWHRSENHRNQPVGSREILPGRGGGPMKQKGRAGFDPGAADYFTRAGVPLLDGTRFS